MDDIDKLFANRGNWKFDKDSGEWVRFTPEPKPITSHLIITDEMPPTQHPCDGKWYTSRAKYHATTRAFNMEYYDDAGGNDKYFRPDPTPIADEADIIDDIKKARNLLRYNEAPMTADERELARKKDEISINNANNSPEIEPNVGTRDFNNVH